MRLNFWHCAAVLNPCEIWVGLRWRRYPCGLHMDIAILPMVQLQLYFQWHPKGW